MERDVALKTMEAWRQLNQSAPATQQIEAHLWRALAVLVPDGCPMAAIDIEGNTKVISLIGRTLLELACLDDPPGLRAVSRTIDPASATVEMTERVEEFGNQLTRGFARVR